MKALAYLQIAPVYSRGGNLIGIAAKKVSTKVPRCPIAGAVLLKLNIDIPDKVFKPVKVDIVVPIENLEKIADVTIEPPTN